jgi:hypothetical protein
MRTILHFIVTVSLAAGVLASAQGQNTDPTKILAAAREALGGDQKLAAVKTFVATGRTRQVRGNNLVPIEFEIACELPDKYVRRDEIPAQESGPTSTGFNGERLIQLPPPPEPPPQLPRPATVPASTTTSAAPPPPATTPPAPARPAGPPAAPPDPRRARVTSLKQDFVKLTLGMFATSFSSYPLTFSLAGQAEAPQGKADVIDVKGAGNFALRFFINSETHLPIMVSWTMPATSVVMIVPGQPAPETIAPGSIRVETPPPPGPTATKEEQDKYAKDVQDLRRKALAQAKPVEYRIYYADYRDVGNGLRFPFRLRRAIAGETVEETNFDAFKINARIDLRKFEGLK